MSATLAVKSFVFLPVHAPTFWATSGGLDDVRRPIVSAAFAMKQLHGDPLV